MAVVKDHNHGKGAVAVKQDDALKLLRDSFDVFAARALPGNCIKPYIPDVPKAGRLIVVGAGKAAAAMAGAFETYYDGQLEGAVITRYGFGAPVMPKRIRVIEAAHPLPDRAGQNGVQEIFALLRTAGPDDVVVALVSGGGSSLLSAPVHGVDFSELQNLNRLLLRSGADITEMNIVRKHLNLALGGGLAKACAGAKMITLAISDVVGDDPSIIASGPTVADPSTLTDALGVLRKYEISPAPSILAALKNDENETAGPDDPIFDGHDYHLIATPKQSLDAAAAFWRDHAIEPYILGAEMDGDTNLCAMRHVDFIHRVLEGKAGISRPCVILSGGETTVKITHESPGQGGPNSQFMLQAAQGLGGAAQVYGLACDSDGIDGIGDHAGAILTPDILKKARDKGLQANEYMAMNDSYAFFDALDCLVRTGPTYTNVNDYRAFLILP